VAVLLALFAISVVIVNYLKEGISYKMSDKEDTV
jgi:hypothetical protein